jgi:hypothetical protein
MSQPASAHCATLPPRQYAGWPSPRPPLRWSRPRPSAPQSRLRAGCGGLSRGVDDDLAYRDLGPDHTADRTRSPGGQRHRRRRSAAVGGPAVHRHGRMPPALSGRAAPSDCRPCTPRRHDGRRHSRGGSAGWTSRRSGATTRTDRRWLHRQWLPSGDSPGGIPRLFVVSDAGGTGGAGRSGVGFGNDEHDGKSSIRIQESDRACPIDAQALCNSGKTFLGSYHNACWRLIPTALTVDSSVTWSDAADCDSCCSP